MDRVSDHTRLWVQLREPEPGNKCSFKFFNHFTSHSRFLEVMATIWGSFVQLYHTRSTLIRLYSKLKSRKFELRKLNKDLYGDIPFRVKSTFEDLHVKQNEVITNPSSLVFMTTSEASEKWHHLLGIEEKCFRQNSRIQWHYLGDQNTSYFHKVTKSRASKNAIKD